MDYVEINPQAAIDELMAQRYADYKWNEFTQKIDADSLSWCADVAKITESGDGGILAEAQSESSNEKSLEANSLSEKFFGKISDDKIVETVVKAIEDRKLEWLPQYIASVETEYAQHEALAIFEEAEGNTQQAEIHRIVMLRNEAAQQVALKILRER